jgi:hypothetical protein
MAGMIQELAGNFLNTRDGLVLFINNGGGDGRVLIAGVFGQDTRYLELKTDSPLLNGWHNPGDIQLAGDFMGIGHDQVLFINNSGHDGRVLIADFSTGSPPANIKYWESYGQSDLLNGWHNPGDIQLAGDFFKDTRDDQVLFINNAGGDGRVLIADFSTGSPPANIKYLQLKTDRNWLNDVLNVWHNSRDVVRAGDFIDYGHDSVLFIYSEPIKI